MNAEEFDLNLAELKERLRLLSNLPANHRLANANSIYILNQISEDILKITKDFEQRHKGETLASIQYKGHSLNWPNDFDLISRSTSRTSRKTFVQLPFEEYSQIGHKDLKPKDKVHKTSIYFLMLILRNGLVLSIPEFMGELKRIGVEDTENAVRSRISRFKSKGIISSVEGEEGLYTIPPTFLETLQHPKYYELEADLNHAMEALFAEKH